MMKKMKMCLVVPRWLMIHVELCLQARGSCLRCLRKTLTGGMPTWCKLTCVYVFIEAQFLITPPDHNLTTLVVQVHPVLLQRRVEWRYSQNGAE